MSRASLKSFLENELKFKQMDSDKNVDNKHSNFDDNSLQSGFVKRHRKSLTDAKFEVTNTTSSKRGLSIFCMKCKDNESNILKRPPSADQFSSKGQPVGLKKTTIF